MYRHRIGRIRFKKNLGETMIKQVLICILIVLIVILAKKMNIAAANKAVEAFHAQFYKDYAVTDIIESGKTVAAGLRDGTTNIVASLLNGDKAIDFTTPADGPGVLAASSGNTKGKSLQFKAEEELQVYAAAGGTVAEIGKGVNDSKYIKITHGNDIVSLYGGISDVYVQTLEKVRKGQIIGSVGESEKQLLFEIWVDGRMVDPTEYIDY